MSNIQSKEETDVEFDPHPLTDGEPKTKRSIQGLIDHRTLWLKLFLAKL